MAKAILGVDIGYNSLKLALVKNGTVLKTASVSMPKNLMKEGRVVSTEAMGELIHDTMKEYGIRCSEAACVLSNESVFLRSVVMPQMTVDQLLYNLPFEFNDYLTEEPKNYAFDYAVLSINNPSEDQEGGASAGTMELMAVAVPLTLLEDYRALLRKAGLKLVKAAPDVCSYISLIRNFRGSREDQEYCILDLGYQAIRMYMFRGDRHVVTRLLEMGVSSLDTVIADAYNVDVHLAHTYLTTNYENCQQKDFCLNAYNNIAVDLMRAMNFYRFSNPDSQLSDVWLCGGGASIPPLRSAIAETLDMQVHPANELINGQNVQDSNVFIQAIGITMD